MATSALIAPLAYFWLIGRYGWSDTDDGFVLGSAWRVLNGQTPYIDFIDIRPPTTAWLHSLWLGPVPRTYAFAAGRLVSIAEVWAYSLAAVWALARASGRRARLVAPLAVAGLLVSQSAFTPMPWHTIDGLLFCGLAASLLIVRSGPATALAAGLLLLAGMGAKQSFYPVAPLAIAFLIADRRGRDAAVLAVVLAAGTGLFALWLATSGGLGAFLAETSARTGFGEVAAAGFGSYLEQGLGPLLVGAVHWQPRGELPRSRTGRCREPPPCWWAAL